MVLILIAVSLADCAAPAQDNMSRLNADNGTTLPLTLLVNGATVASLDPMSGPVAIPATSLPSLPWLVEVRSSTGRRILELAVEAQNITRTTGPGGQVEMHGAAARAELSCGVVDLWVGPPLAGPPPGPGQEGDCIP